MDCMASLLNRMKSLIARKEMEIVDFDDIREDEDFTTKAAKRLLQNEDFYSLYSKVYEHKEQGVDENLEKAENINIARTYRSYARERMGWSRIS